jgi:hypothetical protein
VLSQLLPLSAGRRGEKKADRLDQWGGQWLQTKKKEIFNKRSGTSRRWKYGDICWRTNMGSYWFHFLNFNIRFNRLNNFSYYWGHTSDEGCAYVDQSFNFGSYRHLHENRSVYEMLIHLLSLIGIVIFLRNTPISDEQRGQ